MNLIDHSLEEIIFLKKIASNIIEKIRYKFKEIEVTILKRTGISLDIRWGKIENIIYNNDNYIKLIIFSNKRKSIVSSTDLSYKSINKIINHANDILKYTTKDLQYGLPAKEILAFKALDLNLYHPIKNFNLIKIIDLISEVEQYGLDNDKRIINTEGSNFQSNIVTKIIGNSHNFIQSSTGSKYSISCSLIAKDNNSMERDYSYSISRSLKDLNSPIFIGKDCAKKVISRLNSRKIFTQNSPVLFSSEIAVSIFYYLSKAIFGEIVYKKSTFLLKYLGKKIFPSWISIKEFPHILKGLYSSYFDQEGVKTSNLKIVKNGILNTWLLNNFYAKKLGFISNGHDGNIYTWKVSNKNLTKNELIKLMYKGLIVTETMGQGINYMTGDYSKGVSGFWVENGKIQFPVKEITIAGNLKNMFLDIINISNDIELRTNIQCGSILISSMKIAGI
ncbi:metalloprotease PmbA [Sodalis-like secondary symbiont of Drepanosiphum platanoidis]|uniref:metalloprotease PmbA n=1 Tax=Sodalis-like secondary symbiont of Drepanosiphum platanoidis TaxID=2994493 RepID=UPI003464C2DD